MSRMIKHFRPAPAAAVATLAAVSGAWIAWAPVADAQDGQDAPGQIVNLVEATSPAVVTVLSTIAAGPQQGPQGSPFGPGSPFEDFFRQFGNPGGPPFPPQGRGPERGPEQGPEGRGLGSGFVIEEDGYVVTNNHVVDNATSVQVRMADEREFDARVVGTDPQTDLALLKIDAEDLPYLDLGDSDALRVGEDVIAVGNPFGLGGTVTRGIVSALSRDINAGPYVDFIQTDAAINRGNSGGPLLNLEGEVIGVNSAIYSPNGGSVGVGFAIPSNTVETVIADLRSEGSVERGWLGVSIQAVSPEIATALGLGEPRGALVAEVLEDSPAMGTLETGDVILSLDGEAVESNRDLPRLVAAASPDEAVEVEVLRGGGTEMLEITLGRLDAERVAAAADPDPQRGSASDTLGATLAAVTPEARMQLGLDEAVEGVVITSLDGDGPAASAGLEVGDVILQVGGAPVSEPAEVNAAVEGATSDAVLMQVERGGNRLFVGVRVA